MKGPSEVKPRNLASVVAYDAVPQLSGLAERLSRTIADRCGWSVLLLDDASSDDPTGEHRRAMAYLRGAFMPRCTRVVYADGLATMMELTCP